MASYPLQKALPVVIYKVTTKLEELYGFRNDDGSGMPIKQPCLRRPSFVSVSPHFHLHGFPMLFTGRNPDYLTQACHPIYYQTTTFLRLVQRFLRLPTAIISINSAKKYALQDLTSNLRASPHW